MIYIILFLWCTPITDEEFRDMLNDCNSYKTMFCSNVNFKSNQKVFPSIKKVYGGIALATIGNMVNLIKNCPHTFIHVNIQYDPSEILGVNCTPCY